MPLLEAAMWTPEDRAHSGVTISTVPAASEWHRIAAQISRNQAATDFSSRTYSLPVDIIEQVSRRATPLLEQPVGWRSGLEGKELASEGQNASTDAPHPVAWLLVDRIGRAMHIAVLVAAIGPVRFRFAIDGGAGVQAYLRIDHRRST